MKRARWLIVAAILFICAALLMRGEEKESVKEMRRAARQVELPRYPKPEEAQRARKRSTLFEVVPRDEPGAPPIERHRDPFLVALPSASERDNAVVIEANAIRYSAFGERLIACISRGKHAELEELKTQLGIDPFEDLDRIGITDQLVAVSGNFGASSFRASLLEHAKERAHGDSGMLYSHEGSSETIGLWKNELILMGDNPQEVEAAIDRLEGRAERPPPAIREEDAYGEIYGHISAKTLLEILPSSERERLEDRLSRAAERIDLHVSVQDDVGLVASVRGEDGPELTDLAKSLGAALAVGRVTAKAQGEDELAEVLDLARVAKSYRARGKETFDTELVLPRLLLEKHLAEVCPMGDEAPAP